ncbi:relaxase/mobilization nuclease domain-containing protein [Mucilaginibacter rigui]|uniref:Relaxase/mobilization nuclease domain-containing protein n=1 Tax=Mucilaginibacter rigui TaxID=534635 RepID=A0ABR7X4A8_9SPHI|nr:relaxase/mobilization nuclease domain-containing protein [Mucilaginibacter rigui]MBD1385419.1 relaxase/mobilization nuclease domain-containing protein [Mucilaginibacter rigui]
MIAVEKFGSNFMGALAYNLKKLNHPDKAQRAELLASTFSSLSAGSIKKEVDLIRSLRPALSKYVWHTSLNFSKDEYPGNLSNEKLLQIGLEYMRSMGYDDNQHLVIRHFDAEHPHIHLLVNRIRLDGTVVSDSNNYRRSQSVLRRLEQQYNLIPLGRANNIAMQLNGDIASDRDNSISAELYDGRANEQDNSAASLPDNRISSYQNSRRPTDRNNKLSQRSLRKNEIERTIRTGFPSDKALLQAILDPIIYERKLNLSEFIARCHKAEVSLLFNQASTGRISGITYFINDFKIKGQSLGNRFKWAEIVKYIDYEQDRDGKAVSAANSGTKAKYGELTYSWPAGSDKSMGGRTTDVTKNSRPDADQRDSERKAATGDGRQERRDHESLNKTGAKSSFTGKEFDGSENNDRSDVSDRADRNLYNYQGIDITDDVDDEAIHGRNRHRQKQARTNRR